MTPAPAWSADALEIEANAKRRLADEYDVVQPEEAQKGGRPKTVPDENGFTAAEAGLTRQQVFDARQIRNAEAAKPGIIRDTLNTALAEGREPTKAMLNG